MKIDPNVSVFAQLAEHLRKEIFSGKRQPGSRMESIRDMAVLLEVNPNTIKRVYQELEQEGLIETPGTSGSFVNSNPDFILHSKNDYLRTKAEELAKLFLEVGVDDFDLSRVMKRRNKQ